jgi:hypothetical protein
LPKALKATGKAALARRAKGISPKG